jgi:hypothetical protein
LSKDIPEPVYNEHGVKCGKREIERKRRTEDLSVAVGCKGVFRVKARRGCLPFPYLYRVTTSQASLQSWHNYRHNLSNDVDELLYFNFTDTQMNVDVKTERKKKKL